MFKANKSNDEKLLLTTKVIQEHVLWMGRRRKEINESFTACSTLSSFTKLLNVPAC